VFQIFNNRMANTHKGHEGLQKDVWLMTQS